jgi:glutathione S-transferase
MTDLILHHFETSPFSEKVRRVLAHKRMHWKSVLVPPMLPKPDVVELTGGYRRTPILQVGADVYCDTALICEVLERLQPTPSIYPGAVQGLARILAQWADTTLFWAAVAGPRNPARMNGGLPPAAVQAFAEDRKAMFGSMKLLPIADAAAALASYVQRLSDTLADRPFLLGNAPSVADFAAYHPLWLTRLRQPVEADVLGRTANLRDWMDRMEALGAQDAQDFDAPRAIAVAAAAQPLPAGTGPLGEGAFVDRHGIALGESVTITAESFGSESTAGVLVAATRGHYTLRRTGDRVGAVHVHFPRAGYVLARA